MPLATLCPNCAYRWTLSEAVSRSWFCPRCGSGRDEVSYHCVCGHSDDQHDTMRDVENSLEALAIRAEDLTDDVLEDLPEEAPEPDPPIGGCRDCGCLSYERPPGPVKIVRCLR